uniref:Uncharacterized protein n=1 Tax=Arundo donax TaxID=35708 RepID=A0A0A9EHP2_ARUDO
MEYGFRKFTIWGSFISYPNTSISIYNIFSGLT